jgi:S-adenosylmethionine:tRNA ribosyltransferase-isomerase
MFSLSDYNYELPSDLIAQQPAMERDRSRLLIMNRQSGKCSHSVFCGLADWLSPDDVLVINDTAVIPGRLQGRKDSGGKIEVLISDYAGGCQTDGEAGSFVCQCLLKASKRPRPGTWLYFDQGLKAQVIDSFNGTHTVKFHHRGDFDDLICRIGEVPLPPYIKRSRKQTISSIDRTAYQTVYASEKGAVAAPTAGLHFTDGLLGNLRSKGIGIVPITLHIGYGTFSPVRESDIRDHKMHSERFVISKVSAERINNARDAGKRIIAVGTTCVRTLEYTATDSGKIVSGSGSCDLFIYPGYRFKVVNAMVTNFHLPQSTLLMLVSAFAGRENIMNAYQEAIHHKYRFYSYGDAMFIL